MKKRLFIVFVNIIMSINVFSGLYYSDYLDNNRYKSEFNIAKNLLFNSIDLIAVKMLGDTQPYNSVPTILIIDNSTNRIVWNCYNGADKITSYNNSVRDGFNLPAGICAFSNKDIFMSELLNNRIIKLQWQNCNLVYVKEYSGVYPNLIFHPYQLCLDKFENIYITNTGYVPGILVLDSDLNFIKIIGANILRKPQGVASTYYGNIFVSDMFNKIIKFDTTTGAELIIVKSSDIEYIPINANFGYMDCDIHDNLYVVDPVNNKIYKFYELSSENWTT